MAEQLARSVKTKARKISGGAKEWAWDPCEPWDGTPPDRRQKSYLHAALAREAAKVAQTAKGGRNDAIFDAALKLGSYVAGAGLGEQRVIAALQAARRRRRLHRRGRACGRTRATIRSGLRAGKQNPRAVPPPKTEEHEDGRAEGRGVGHRAAAGTARRPPPYGSIDGAALLEDLRAWFARFLVVVAETDLRLLALWVVHTFLCHELYTTPRLLIDSIAPGSGKTTLLEHLDHLCRNPLLAMSVSSAALIPRILDKEPRTVLLDEIQRTLVEGKPGVDEVIAVINSGYRRGASRPVLVPQGTRLGPARPAHLRPGGDGRQLPAPAPGHHRPVHPHPADARHRRRGRGLRLGGPRRRRQGAAAQRASDWADSVRAHVKDAKGMLPAKCVGRLREKWRPLMRVAELADGAGGRPGRTW